MSELEAKQNQNPQQLDPERALLGALASNPSSWWDVANLIAEKDFAVIRHKVLWRNMERLSNAGQPIDRVTLFEELRVRGELDQAGGLGYLRTLFDDNPQIGNIVAYAQLVQDRSRSRRIEQVTSELAAEARNASGNLSEFLDDANRKLSELLSEGSSNVLESDTLMSLALSRWDELSRLQGGLAGLSTGMESVDEHTMGLQPGKLYIIAARPGMGKTSFALKIAHSVAVEQNKTTAFWSLEMPAVDLVHRMASMHQQINSAGIARGKLSPQEAERFTKGIKEIGSSPFIIVDQGEVSIANIRSQARSIKARRGSLSLIVVDYLQLMRGVGVSNDLNNRVQEVSQISRGLKLLARELSVPVIALSQLSRAVEGRQNRRPLLSDLRDSGSIEQDADMVMFLYRDDYYDPNSDDAGMSEVITAKNRAGPLGVARLKWNSEFTTFADLKGEEKYVF